MAGDHGCSRCEEDVGIEIALYCLGRKQFDLASVKSVRQSTLITSQLRSASRCRKQAVLPRYSVRGTPAVWHSSNTRCT